MSFSLSVPAGEPDTFEQRLKDARQATHDAVVAGGGVPDQIDSSTCDAACSAAVALASSLGAGTTGMHVGAVVSGHHPTPDSYAYPSASASVNFSACTEDTHVEG